MPLVAMAPTQFKKQRANGNTYRKCLHCNGYHANPKHCQTANSLMTKKSRSQPNFTRYRHFHPSVTPDQYYQFVTNSNRLDRHRASKRRRTAKHLKTKSPQPTQKIKKQPPKTIECPICLTTRGKWRKLGCNHTICQECYENTLKSDAIGDNCPMCRQSIFSENFADYLITATKPSARSYTLINMDRQDDLDEDWLDEIEDESEDEIEEDQLAELDQQKHN